MYTDFYASLTQSYFSVPIWMTVIILDTYIGTRAFQYCHHCESQAPVRRALLSSDNSCINIKGNATEKKA